MYYLNLAYLIARSALFIIQLLPIYCWYIYTNFASETGGAICILMINLFDCQKCTSLRPNYCLFIAGICMPILCSEIGGAICIIMTGTFDYQYFI